MGFFRRARGFFVLAGATAIGYRVGSFIPSNQYPVAVYSETLTDHPYVTKLLQEGWKLNFRQVDRIPAFHRKNMVLSGMLAGRDMFVASPISLHKGEEHQTVFWLGSDLTHQPTVTRGWMWQKRTREPAVHNGMAVTMLDHTLAQTALRGRRALTKTLEADFKQDIPAGVLVVKSHPGESRKRSAVAEGSLYEVKGDQLGDELVQGRALMVRPKWAW